MRMPTQSLFSALSQVNFNHRGRDDPQQVFMERLEIMAVETGLKPAFAAGQSGHNLSFNRQLEKFAANNGFLAVSTPGVSAFTQLLALPTHNIGSSLLKTITMLIRQSVPNPDQQILWLFKDSRLKESIDLCVAGQIPVGDVLGYPRCCTDGYLELEAQRMQTELDYFRQHHGAKTDADLVALYQSETDITGPHKERIEVVCSTMTTRQANSIKRLPFVHFIACPRCQDDPGSPAAQLNQKMAQLASDLSPTFARKFTSYAENYFRIFQQTRTRTSPA